jgi:ATP-dependent Clp protease protease subunit
MNDAQPEEAAKQMFSPVEGTLLKHRMLTLFGEINQDVARATVNRLLALAFESAEPLTMLISSPGGHVESGDAIFDTMRFIKPVVRVVGTGWVGSIATHIFLSPAKEHRFSMPNTRFLIHQPSGGFGGDASDIEIHAREIMKTRERINQVIAQQTGQTLERVNLDTERDYWMSVEEARDYGLVGKIINTIDEVK